MNRISKTLQEVWTLKEACYEEVKNMPLKDAIKKRLSDSLEHTKKLGFMLQKSKNKTS
jgi:hypothetical protein